MAAEVCFLCTQPFGDGRRTQEHVVPRCLYPGPLPSNAFTLRSHPACNKTTERAETLFRNHIAGIAGGEVFAAFLRSFERREERRTADKFHEEFIVLPNEEGGFATCDNLPIAYTLAKIAKGFVLKELGALLPPRGVGWIVHNVVLPVDVPDTKFSRVAEPTEFLRCEWDCEPEKLRGRWLFALYKTPGKHPVEEKRHAPGGALFTLELLPWAHIIERRARGAIFLPWPSARRKSR